MAVSWEDGGRVPGMQPVTNGSADANGGTDALKEPRFLLTVRRTRAHTTKHGTHTHTDI